MTYDTDIDKPIRDFVAAGSGIPIRFVIPGNADIPRPKQLYATVLWIDGEPRMVDQTRLRTSLEIEDVFSVQWYRDGAQAAARRFIVWAQSDLALLEQQRGGFRVVRPFGLRNLDYVVSNKFEQRVGLDMRVRWCYALSEDSGTVQELTGGEVSLTVD